MITERIGPPLIAGEREMLRAFLDYHRATLAMKCDGRRLAGGGRAGTPDRGGGGVARRDRR